MRAAFAGFACYRAYHIDIPSGNINFGADADFRAESGCGIFSNNSAAAVYDKHTQVIHARNIQYDPDIINICGAAERYD
jgi:hypothetical protein